MAIDLVPSFSQIFVTLDRISEHYKWCSIPEVTSKLTCQACALDFPGQELLAAHLAENTTCASFTPSNRKPPRKRPPRKRSRKKRNGETVARRVSEATEEEEGEEEEKGHGIAEEEMEGGDEDEDATSASSLSIEMVSEMEPDETENGDARTKASVADAAVIDNTHDITVKTEPDFDDRTLESDVNMNGTAEGDEERVRSVKRRKSTKGETSKARKGNADSDLSVSPSSLPANAASSSSVATNPNDHELSGAVMSNNLNLTSSHEADATNCDGTLMSSFSTPTRTASIISGQGSATRRSRRRAAEEARQSINDVTKHLRDGREGKISTEDVEDVFGKSELKK